MATARTSCGTVDTASGAVLDGSVVQKASNDGWNGFQMTQNRLSTYGKDQTRPNSLGTLRAATTPLERSRTLRDLGGPQLARGTEQCGMARQSSEQAQDNNDILGRDPAGPLAPLGGTESLLHSPHP